MKQFKKWACACNVLRTPTLILGPMDSMWFSKTFSDVEVYVKSVFLLKMPSKSFKLINKNKFTWMSTLIMIIRSSIRLFKRIDIMKNWRLWYKYKLVKVSCQKKSTRNDIERSGEQKKDHKKWNQKKGKQKDWEMSLLEHLFSLFKTPHVCSFFLTPDMSFKSIHTFFIYQIKWATCLWVIVSKCLPSYKKISPK